MRNAHRIGRKSHICPNFSNAFQRAIAPHCKSASEIGSYSVLKPDSTHSQPKRDDSQRVFNTDQIKILLYHFKRTLLPLDIHPLSWL